MTESFLYYLWSHKLISDEIITSDNEKVMIISPGFINDNEGPDFSNAKIKIGNTIWAGNIEIHMNSSDWFLHCHGNNINYNSIILHVVYNQDLSIDKLQNIPAPTVSIKNKFDFSIYSKYNALQSNKEWLLCGSNILKIDNCIIKDWLNCLVFEKLESKINEIKLILSKSKYDWEETFYILLMRNFGFNVNSDNFELLAKSVNYKTINKCKNSKRDIEVILFGIGGFLENSLNDIYMIELHKYFQFLTKKYNLAKPEGIKWKYLRLRPSNFPTIRISQVSNLLNNHDFVFSNIINIDDISDLKKLFNISASNYWNNHYIFGSISNNIEIKHLGDTSIDIIIINTIIPIMFLYGKEKGNIEYIERALSFLEKISQENNSHIKEWENHGINASNALESQALIFLKRNYCQNKKCLECRIGCFILKSQ